MLLDQPSLISYWTVLQGPSFATMLRRTVDHLLRDALNLALAHNARITVLLLAAASTGCDRGQPKLVDLQPDAHQARRLDLTPLATVLTAVLGPAVTFPSAAAADYSPAGSS